MTYQETLDYIESLQTCGIAPGLENIRNLCEKLGNPQKELSFIHIAGTNGKGSVLCLLSSVLKQSGYRVGRYISPTIFTYRERFQIGGRMITQKDLAAYMTRIRKACEALLQEGYPQPTPFEVETALAFLYFKEKKCDIVVLETGMGGLMDATNVIPAPIAAVITSISMDHMQFLGNTLPEIALQKAGIIKEGCEVATGKQDETVLKVLQNTCNQTKCRLTLADEQYLSHVRSKLTGQQFSYKDWKDLQISLPGRYQLSNAILALETVSVLRERGLSIPDKAVFKGFETAEWPGRFEILSKKPLFIADGAHNRDGADKLAESLRYYFTKKRLLYIIGMLRDKEQEEVIRLTCPLAQQILTVSTKGPRGFSSYELAQKIQPYQASVTCTDSVQEAVELAYLMAGRDKDTVIVAFGSLSYLGELMTTVKSRNSRYDGKI